MNEPLHSVVFSGPIFGESVDNFNEWLGKQEDLRIINCESSFNNWRSDWELVVFYQFIENKMK
jgi:hypothetical protein